MSLRWRNCSTWTLHFLQIMNLNMGHKDKKKSWFLWSLCQCWAELVIGFIHTVPLKKTSLFNEVDVASLSLSLPFLFLLLHFHDKLVQVPLHYCRHPNTAILTTRQQRAREGRVCKREWSGTITVLVSYWGFSSRIMGVTSRGIHKGETGCLWVCERKGGGGGGKGHRAKCGTAADVKASEAYSERR